MKKAIVAGICTIVILSVLGLYESATGRNLDLAPLYIYFLLLISLRQTK